MILVDPIGDGSAKIVEFDASDDAVSGRVVEVCCVVVFVASESIRLNQFECQWDRSIDASVFARWKSNNAN